MKSGILHYRHFAMTAVDIQPEVKSLSWIGSCVPLAVKYAVQIYLIQFESFITHLN